MNKAISMFQMHSRQLLRAGLAFGLLLSVWMAYDIATNKLPQTKQLSDLVLKGNASISRVDIVKLDAAKARSAFNKARHNKAAAMLFDDVDSVSAFINAISESFRGKEFITTADIHALTENQILEQMGNKGKSLDDDIRWIGVNLRVRPSSVKASYKAFIDILNRFPAFGRKVDVQSITIVGSGSDFTGIDLRLVLWGGFDYAGK